MAERQQYDWSFSLNDKSVSFIHSFCDTCEKFPVLFVYEYDSIWGRFVFCFVPIFHLWCIFCGGKSVGGRSATNKTHKMQTQKHFSQVLKKKKTKPQLLSQQHTKKKIVVCQ